MGISLSYNANPIESNFFIEPYLLNRFQPGNPLFYQPFTLDSSSIIVDNSVFFH